MIKKERPISYALKHKNEKIRRDSQSGGAFTAFSDTILEAGGVVYGCVTDADKSAVHIRADSIDQRNRMRGSKYIQSRIEDTYMSCKKDLEEGREVLFSGTSCQVAALQKYLGKEYDNLVCADIICHGVPSPYVWKRYLEWWEKKKKEKITKVEFRNKRDFGWHSHMETLTFESGIKVNAKIFRNLFYGHYILRPCCYECPYKKIVHPGNITIGDCWGIEKADPEFDDNEGISLVLINDCKGEKIYEKSKHNFCVKSVEIENVLQKPLLQPFERPYNREKFWEGLKCRGFRYLEMKYGAESFYFRIIRKIRDLLNTAKERE
ncbi:MAG: Coenzyme F420 hydrogenase/dehydrogenase, beta subunit C-terminal domain [Acetatifactor sp.]